MNEQSTVDVARPQELWGKTWREYEEFGNKLEI